MHNVIYIPDEIEFFANFFPKTSRTKLALTLVAGNNLPKVFNQLLKYILSQLTFTCSKSVNNKNTSDVVLVFLLLTLNKYMIAELFI